MIKQRSNVLLWVSAGVLGLVLGLLAPLHPPPPPKVETRYEYVHEPYEVPGPVRYVWVEVAVPGPTQVVEKIVEKVVVRPAHCLKPHPTPISCSVADALNHQERLEKR